MVFSSVSNSTELASFVVAAFDLMKQYRIAAGSSGVGTLGLLPRVPRNVVRVHFGSPVLEMLVLEHGEPPSIPSIVSRAMIVSAYGHCPAEECN